MDHPAQDYMDSNRQPSRPFWARATKSMCLMVCGILLSLPTSAQTYEWEIDKNNRLAEQRAQQKDSAWRHMKGKWEIGLTYGNWLFLPAAKSNADERFFFPVYFGIWQLGGAWHMSEKLSTTLSVGIQLHRNTPPTPDISTILSGGEVDLEGSVGGFFPVSASVRYALTDGQLRPFVGLGGGLVIGSARYIKAQGFLPDDIERITLETQGNAPFGKVSAGATYRASKHVQLEMSCAYDHSGNFEEPLGGYLRYQGLRINVGLGIVL